MSVNVAVYTVVAVGLRLNQRYTVVCRLRVERLMTSR